MKQSSQLQADVSNQRGQVLKPVLSICTTVKNRSRLHVEGRELQLFPKCIQSLVRSVPSDLPCELVVTDWQSDDWPLADWLREAANPVPVQIISVSGQFSRGRGRNLAAVHARADAFLFLDADCLLSRRVIESGLCHLANGKAFFPILYSFDGPEHQAGWWRDKGFGNCLVSRNTFERAGGWPEYEFWGEEDDHFYSRVASVVDVARERVPDFYHQWHPNDLEWKDRYGDRSAYVRMRAERAEETKREIAEVIPPGETYILVDEAFFADESVTERRALPFLERDGQYWGLPADSESAIAELERLRRLGAASIAFAWPAFWWLDYYVTFHEHLCERYHRILENDRLVIFDLKS